MRSGKGQRRLHSWTFAQFRAFLAYKAQERGMRVVAIDPRHTSQTCSKCGYQYRHNRKSQSLFKCRKCFYTLNADLNASYNIRDRGAFPPGNKHLASFGISLAGGPPSIGLSHPTSVEVQAAQRLYPEGGISWRLLTFSLLHYVIPACFILSLASLAIYTGYCYFQLESLGNHSPL